jgi:hypothetical protein
MGTDTWQAGHDGAGQRLQRGVGRRRQHAQAHGGVHGNPFWLTLLSTKKTSFVDIGVNTIVDFA